MNILKTTLSERRWSFRRIATGLVLAAVAASIAAPAMADDHRRRDDHGRDRYRHARGYYAAPAPVYAPPGVIYAPPPAPAALNFVFPLNFR
jgi:hypothetical protein